MAASQTVLQTWTEVCHQIFGDFEGQNMYHVYREARFSKKKKSLQIG